MISVKTMYELEKILQKDFFYQSSNSEETEYLMKARKLPLHDIKNIIEISKENWMFINEYLLVNQICQRYHCTESLLYQRLDDVNKIMKYEQSISKELLKEQKRMIKRMNKI